MAIYTIGHSNHSLEKFIQLLNDNGIMILVDVRTAPYSRYRPHFNKESLEFELPRHNIQYIFAGKYLGGRPSDPRLYKNRELPPEDADYLHEVDYQEVMKRQWFIQAIEQLLEIADQDLTAILCSEEDPSDCHRHHLIAKYLIDNHPEVRVRHIRADGSVYGAQTILKSVNKPKAEQGRLL
jgi:uncharacterized protein (DUF488 family)